MAQVVHLEFARVGLFLFGPPGFAVSVCLLGQAVTLLLEPVALGTPLGEVPLRAFLARIPRGQQGVGVQQGGLALGQARTGRTEGAFLLGVLLRSPPQLGLGLRMTGAKCLELFFDVRQGHARRQRLLLPVLPFVLQAANLLLREGEPLLQLLHPRFRGGGLCVRLFQCVFQRRDLLFQRGDLRAADLDLLVQAGAPLLVLADARTEVGRLFRQHVDFDLLRRRLRVEPGHALAQVAEVAVQFRQAQVEDRDLFTEVAQLALARQDAGLRVVGADGHGAVDFHQLSLERDAAEAGDRPGQRSRCGQVADDQRAAEQARRQVGETQVVTTHHALRRGDDAMRGNRGRGVRRREQRGPRLRCAGVAGMATGRQPQEADASREWLAALAYGLFQGFEVADHEALGALAQRHVDQRRELAAHGQKVGHEPQYVVAPCGLAGLFQQGEHLAGAGAQPFMAAFQPFQYLDAAADAAAPLAQLGRALCRFVAQ